MFLENEFQVYENVEVSCITEETESYEYTFFVNVIRRRELDFIKSVLRLKSRGLFWIIECGGCWLSWIMYMSALMFSDFWKMVSSLLC